MRKKSSIGVKVFGIVGIIFSTISFIIFISTYQGSSSQTFLQIIAAFVMIVCSIGVLRLIDWSRIGMIITSTYFIVDSFIPLKYFISAIKNFNILGLLILTIGLILFSSTIYFFTRPKVKEQFK